MNGRTMAVPIAREGYPFIVPMAIATLVFGLVGWAYPAALLSGITCFVIYFFRNPNRTPPSSEDAIVSPADGRVLEVTSQLEQGFLQREAVKISIFMSLFDVHVNRSPIAGRVTRRAHHPGTFFPANTDKSSLLNEQNAVLLCSSNGFEILCVQIAGIIARRIVCYAQEGNVLQKGQIFGMIRFGSRVDIFLPPSVDIRIRVGDHVRAGETILGYRNDEETKERN